MLQGKHADMKWTLGILCFCVISVFLRTAANYQGCDNEVEECIYPHECVKDSRPASEVVRCQEEKICCPVAQSQPDQVPLRHGHEQSRPNAQPRAIFLTPGTGIRLPHARAPNYEYSVGGNLDDTGDRRIVNVQLLNNSLDGTAVPYKKETTSNMYEEESIIVFPEDSEEEDDERIRYIKKMYRKYAMEFKKYNSKQYEEISKRKQKYATGFRSTKYCKLYEEFAVENLMAIPLLPSVYPILLQKNHCSKPLPLIVGGLNASRGEFPHMAALGYDRGEWIDFLCGASLISERYVLTAAHCANTKWGPPIIVRLGTLNLIEDKGQNIDVEDVITHPNYQEPSCSNDIALVRMVPGLKLSSMLRPACLPPPTTLAGNPGHYLMATGWGRIGYGLYASPNLQKVSLEVIDNPRCERLFLGGRRTERLPTGIQSSMLCAAGYLDSSHDTCQGDSGGPLQTTSRYSKCMYEVVGITSFGKLCGTGLPAIYTRVSTYIEWIENIVWP